MNYYINFGNHRIKVAPKDYHLFNKIKYKSNREYSIFCNKMIVKYNRLKEVSYAH